MSKKIYIDNSYLVVEDDVSGRIDISEPKEQIRAFVQDGEVKVRLKSDPSFIKNYKFKELLDVNDIAFTSEGALNTFFRESTGFSTASGGSGAIENSAMTGVFNLDLKNFDSFEGILIGNTTLTVSNTPEEGKSITKSLAITSTTAETLTLPVSWNIYGDFVNDGTRNKLAIEFANYTTAGLKVDCFISQAN